MYKILMRILLFACISLIANLSVAVPSIIPKPPALAASSYILIDANSGKVLVEKDADRILPPASLTKMMTSYVVTEELAYGNIQEDETTRISIKAWKAEGSRMFIQEGTNVSIEDLLTGVIIQSGNDASISFAELISGSENAFVNV